MKYVKYVDAVKNKFAMILQRKMEMSKFGGYVAKVDAFGEISLEIIISANTKRLPLVQQRRPEKKEMCRSGGNEMLQDQSKHEGSSRCSLGANKNIMQQMI